MLLSVEFRSHSAIALYVKENYVFDVIRVPLPFAFCDAPYKERLAEVLKTVAEAVADESVFSYPAQNKLVVVDESIFGKLKAILGLEVIYINDVFSELLILPEVTRFLPFKINFSELANIRANQSIIGSFFPATPRDAVLQAAVAKAIIRQLGFYNESFPQEILLAGPVFNFVPRPSQAVEIFLDGVDGVGACFLYQDREGLASPMAAASLKVVKSDFIKLGSVVIWPGPAEFELSFEGSSASSQKLKLDGESIVRFAVSDGQSVKIKGSGVGGDFEGELLGGEVGVVIDTRKRPLVLPQTDAVRYKMLKGWWGDLNQ